MPTPAVTLKLKKFRRRFGIAAPRVTVRGHFGWQWYAAGAALFALVVGMTVWGLGRQGEAADLQREVDSLRQRQLALDDEVLRLRSSAGTEQNAAQMERTAQSRLVTRIKALESENAALKEDIALFERLVPAEGDESTVRVERLRVVPDSEPGRYRYRLLISFQSGKQLKEFKGRLQFHLLAVQAGKDVHLVLPAAGDASTDYLLEVRNFVRREGLLTTPAGARLKSLEVRIMQGGVVKAKHLAQL